MRFEFTRLHGDGYVIKKQKPWYLFYVTTHY
jgi:hypothetical protein